MSTTTVTSSVLASLDREVESGRSIRSIAKELDVSQPALRSVHIRESIPAGPLLDKLAERYGLQVTGFNEFTDFVASRQKCEDLGEALENDSLLGTGGYFYLAGEIVVVIEDTLTWSEVPDRYMPAGRFFWQAPDGTGFSSPGTHDPAGGLRTLERQVFAKLRQEGVL